jgi:membrane-bound lytic murein transglycosylase D
MRSRLILLTALVMTVLVLGTGCAAVGTSSRASSAGSSSEPSGLSEREKWKMARDAFAKAEREQERKDNEAAAYYYEIALELLGSLDMAAIEVPTQRVLKFQKEVLQSYDKFVASIDKLPSTAGPMAVLDATGSKDDNSDDDLIEKAPADRDNQPVKITPNAPPLPEVPVAMNGRVADQINFFMNKGRKVMMAWMERASHIFPRLRPILAEEGLPDDILYLAMIESGLNPRAVSYAHAAGVWQFIPSTGRIYGLNVDRMYDERMHVEAATRAACRYLRKLHDEFGDWYLAFAAYNCGELRIEREVAHSRNRDYFSLNHLPRQTKSYVPAYLATREIYEHPEKYGFPTPPPEEPFECEQVWVNGSYRLEHVAQAAGLDPDVVRDLNPEFTRGVTPAGSPVMVRLPRKPDKAFDVRLASLPKTDIAPTQIHKVRSGETLASVARKYGVSVKEIIAQPENRGLKAGRLRVGREIVIPVPGSVSQAEVAAVKPAPKAAPESTPEPAEPKAAPTAQAASTPQKDTTAVANLSADPVMPHEIIYKVHSGESLGRIGTQLGVSVAEICRQNNISDPDVIQPGTKLRIKVGGEPVVAERTTAPADTAKAQLHTVQPGETIWSIARSYGKDPMKILSWNRLERDSTIYPGQELIISQE